jgi:hypothetical protein
MRKINVPKAIALSVLMCVLGVGIVYAAPKAPKNASDAAVNNSSPVSKDQCKNDGWKVFSNPIFKNQGNCVSFVETAGKNNKQSILVEPISTYASRTHFEGNPLNFGTYFITFKVTAVDRDIYLDKTLVVSTSTSNVPLGGNRAAVLDETGAVLETDFGESYQLLLLDCPNQTYYCQGSNAVSPPFETGTELIHTFRIRKGTSLLFAAEMRSFQSGALGHAVLSGLEWGTSDSPIGTNVYTQNMGEGSAYATPAVLID